MAACLQSGHQLPLDSIFVSRGKSVPLKSICPEWTRYAPACICLTQGNSFLRINLTQKNASAIGGILSPAGLPTSTQSLSTKHSTHKKLRKKSLIFKRRKESQTRDLYHLTRKREPKTREAFNFAQRDLIFFENLRNQHLHKFHLGVCTFPCFDVSAFFTVSSGKSDRIYCVSLASSRAQLYNQPTNLCRLRSCSTKHTCSTLA